MPEILQFGFMQRALLAGIVIGAVAPAIGTFLVLRRLSLFGETLAHVSLAGVAAGFLWNIYPVLSALGLSLLAAGAIERLRRAYPRHGEVALATTLSAGIGLAAVLISLYRGSGDLLAYLFGNIVTISWPDVIVVAGAGLVALAAVYWLYHDLISAALDEELASIAGLPVRALGLLFALLTAATVAVTMRLVGVLLVSSLMVLPVAAALQLSRSFRAVVIWAIVLGEAAVVVGLALAFYLDLAPGGTVVLTAVALLLGALAAAKGVRRRAGEHRSGVKSTQ